jgi:hypothetical protein
MKLDCGAVPPADARTNKQNKWRIVLPLVRRADVNHSQVPGSVQRR